MSMADSLERDLLKLIFNATALADLAENDSSSPSTSLYVSLHTADPGDSGTQSTSETSYAAYARKAVARTTSGWTVTANSVSPVSNIVFAQCTSGLATITHFGIGTASSGAGYLMFSGTVTSNISVLAGVSPVLTTATTITLD